MPLANSSATRSLQVATLRSVVVPSRLFAGCPRGLREAIQVDGALEQELLVFTTLPIELKLGEIGPPMRTMSVTNLYFVC